ncbi:MAG: hypothetical protein AAF571_04070 [Verrucomicrobiota bacterium]
MKITKCISILILLSLSANSLMACPTCFGAPGDPISMSIGKAIMFLLVIVMGTVGGIIAFFVSVARRTQKYEQQLQEGEAEWGEQAYLAEDQN